MALTQHYLQTAAQLCRQYDASVPFQFYVKHFFSQHKKYGSRDRKMIAGLCYAFFRLGQAARGMEIEERMKLGWFLTSSQPNNLLQQLNDRWNEHAVLSLPEKFDFLEHPFSINQVAPFGSLLSAGISELDYARHFLIQPDVFVRIRPGKRPVVLDKIKSLGWDYVVENNAAIRLPGSSAIDTHFKLNEELVVQDLNSQRVGSVIAETFSLENFDPVTLWDCCAASGGKSIMLKDLYPNIKLTVSDIRASILHNLKKRFKEAGIQHYQAFEADVSKAARLDENFRTKPNFIVADVPCTGSGTWSRTPEQLYFFKEETINEYAEKQFAIAGNALSLLEPGGYFVYITCSVFKKENEENVERLVQQHALELIYSKLLDGTKEKADSMYVAVLGKKA